MAGGSGLRLWPLSRSSRPKQLLKLVGGRSLLQLTWDRIAGLLPAEQIFVCTVESDATAVLADLPHLPADNLLCEPVGRDTANAIGFASALLYEKDPDAVRKATTSSSRWPSSGQRSTAASRWPRARTGW